MPGTAELKAINPTSFINPEFAKALERFIEPAGLSGGQIVGIQKVSGGTINQSVKITLRGGDSFFVKSNQSPLDSFFECESHGLDSIRSTETIRVPVTHGCGSSCDIKFLMLEWIESAKPVDDFFERLGRGLAELHRWNTGRKNFGFDHDNFIGLSTQPNPSTNSWPQFWAEQRLEHQLKLASRNGWGELELMRLGKSLVSRIESLLTGPEEPPSLLHGDLWNGNFMSDEKGHPVLVDPACYFGNREAEFGMITLFGGFKPQFFAAYNEAWPLADGSHERIELYRLYHLLNHLNLFGSSYMDDCLAILRKYAG